MICQRKGKGEHYKQTKWPVRELRVGKEHHGQQNKFHWIDEVCVWGKYKYWGKTEINTRCPEGPTQRGLHPSELWSHRYSLIQKVLQWTHLVED